MSKPQYILVGHFTKFSRVTTSKRIYDMKDYLPPYFFICESRNKKWTKIVNV